MNSKTLYKIKVFLEKKNLLPNYSDETIFLILFTISVISIIDISFQNQALSFVEEFHSFSVIKIGVFVLIGIFYTIKTTFFSIFKTEYAKHMMFWLALVTNGLVTMSLLANPASIFAVAVLSFNLVIITFSFWLFKKSLLDIDTIKRGALSFSNILYGGLFVLLIILVGKYLYNLPWQVLFSTSIAYATLFNRKVVSRLPKIYSKRDQKIIEIEELVEKASLHFKMSNITIVTKDSVKPFPITGLILENIDAYIKQKLLEEDRTHKFIAVIYYGLYTKNHWYEHGQKAPALIINIYENKNQRGYQFINTFDSNRKERSTSNDKIVYYKRIKNPLFI